MEKNINYLNHLLSKTECDVFGFIDYKYRVQRVCYFCVLTGTEPFNLHGGDLKLNLRFQLFLVFSLLYVTTVFTIVTICQRYVSSLEHSFPSQDTEKIPIQCRSQDDQRHYNKNGHRTLRTGRKENKQRYRTKKLTWS